MVIKIQTEIWWFGNRKLKTTSLVRKTKVNFYICLTWKLNHRLKHYCNVFIITQKWFGV